MRRNLHLILALNFLIFFDLSAQEKIQTEKITNIKSNARATSKAGQEYKVFKPREIYHSVAWPDQKENFIIKDYHFAGDINGDGINDMYYFAGSCADERSADIYDIVDKTVIVFGGSDFSELTKQVLYLEIIPIGDLNGDGYSDAIGVNEDLSWQYYLGSSSGLQENATIYESSMPRIWNKFFDIDEDGFDDYLTSSETGQFDVIYGNSTSETFEKKTYSPPDFFVGWLSLIGNIDGTGNKIISFYYGPTSYEYEMYVIDFDAANRTFSLAEELVTVAPNKISLADIDGDGFKEVVYTTTYNPEDSLNTKTIVLPKSTTDGTYYSDFQVLYETPTYSIGDINKDGKSDFYSYDELTNLSYIILGETDYLNGFEKDILLDFSDMNGGNYDSHYTVAKSLGDVNGDGISDFSFFVENDVDMGQRFFFGNQTALTTYDLLYDQSLNGNNNLFQTKNLGDLNGDGYEDVAFMEYSGKYINLYLNGEFDSPEFELKTANSEDFKLVEKGDFNGDDYSDMAVLVRNQGDHTYHRIDFYFGGESLDLEVDHTISFHQDLSCDPFSTDGYGIKFLGDINNDGVDDFMLYGDAQAFIFYGGADLSKTPDHTIAASKFFGARTAATGDMNGDGLDDFAISGMNNGGVSVYFGKGGSADADAYATPDLFLVSTQENGYNDDIGMSLTSGDFNGDGLQDIATMPYTFQEMPSTVGIEGLYIFYGGENMDTIPDLLLKIPAVPFQVDVRDYINRFAGELTSVPDINGDLCEEIYMAGSWYVNNLSGSESQKMQHGIIIGGGDYLNQDSIPLIQLYSTAPQNGATNKFYYTDAHSAFGDFDHDGASELLSTHNNKNFIGTSVYKYSLLIVDNEDPSMTCVEDPTKDADTDQEYYTVIDDEFDPTSISDNGGFTTVTNDFNGLTTLAGEQIHDGTTITWTVADSSSNTSQCSITITVNKENTTGIDQKHKTSKYNLYPNPVKDVLIVEKKNADTEKVRVEVYSVLGEVLGSYIMDQSSFEIDFSSFAPSVYIVNIYSEKESMSFKIIKE